MTPAVSIIIPARNAGRHLAQCLDSCLAQTLRDTQVIAVDDASADSTPAILAAYARRDSRLTVARSPSQLGAEGARQLALGMATGEYIMFIDADDWLDTPRLLASLLRKARRTGAELAATGILKEYGAPRTKTAASLAPTTGYLPAERIMQTIFTDLLARNVTYMASMCGKLYSRAAIARANIPPSRLTWGEDTAFNLQLLPHLSGAYFSRQAHYRYRQGGSTEGYIPTLLADTKSLCRLKMRLARQYGIPRAADAVYPWLTLYLRWHISQLHTILHTPPQELEAIVRRELTDPIYLQLAAELHSPRFASPALARAILTLDAPALCRISLRGE